MIDKFEGEYRFLSNFYPSEITHEGIVYPTNEHYYVAMKINEPQYIEIKGELKLLDVKKSRFYVSCIRTAGDVKRLGRKLKVRDDWDDVKLSVMEYGVRQKFNKHEDLKNMLLATGDEELIEGNHWHDTYWGVCECSKCGNKGLNNLGKTLMMVRDEIRNGRQ